MAQNTPLVDQTGMPTTIDLLQNARHALVRAMMEIVLKERPADAGGRLLAMVDEIDGIIHHQEISNKIREERKGD